MLFLYIQHILSMYVFMFILYHRMEKPKRTVWPTQYYVGNIDAGMKPRERQDPAHGEVVVGLEE